LATLDRLPVIKLVLPCHDRLAVVQTRLQRAWQFLAKWFSGHGFVAARDARRCSGFVPAVIVGSSTAARLAASKPGSANTARPTAGTSAAQKAGSITATGSVATGGARPKLA
jgi:hypothetical protein